MQELGVMAITTPPPNKPLLPLRALVLLVVALVAGTAAGVLTWHNVNAWAAAALAGAAAFGGTLKLLHDLVE
jgi:fatty acid desaturase